MEIVVLYILGLVMLLLSGGLLGIAIEDEDAWFYLLSLVNISGGLFLLCLATDMI